MNLFKTKEEKEQERLERMARARAEIEKIEQEKLEKEKELVEKEKNEYKEKLLNTYYAIVRTLFSKNVLYVVQDYIISNTEDYYDLTSYKLDLVIPVYDGYGRITREGTLFDSEYVLFIAYSIKRKDGDEEKKNVLIHIFNGNSGGFAYIEKDEKSIYERMMKETIDENNKSLIEVYTSILEPDATFNLINQLQEELIKQAQKEQVETIGKAVGAAVLGASAASLGSSIRRLGRTMGV